jgi:uncharacterized protein YxjI
MSVASFLSVDRDLFVRQRRELAEILIDWETRNQYSVLDASGEELALVVERARGAWDFLRRGFLRSHRPLDVGVLDPRGDVALTLTRPFFLLFSSLEVKGPEGRIVGQVLRRFGVIYKRYDLLDATGGVFARVASPRWRLWTFPVEGADGARTATISKKWSGVLREALSDADTFRIDFGSGGWTDEQRAVILAAALAIDFDFFENNQGAGSALDIANG